MFVSGMLREVFVHMKRKPHSQTVRVRKQFSKETDAKNNYEKYFRDLMRNALALHPLI